MGAQRMASNDHSRSAAQTAADLARFAKAAYNIIKAALAAGLKGAAAAAARETLPLLVKVALGILIAILLIPMLIFTALPNMFFGYSSSGTDVIANMTQQALTVGGAYMSLEDFEKSQIDSIVTSIVADYEEEGTAIDRIEVESSFDEEDLLWFIAINSVAHQQNLDAMSAEDIRSFSVSRLSYTPSLLSSEGEGPIVTTLKVSVKKLEPDKLMDQLGFDDDARTWAGALYETLLESNALTKYADQFEAYRPDYSGDSSYSGGVEYGSSYDNEIDISGFVSPDTKNNLDLAAYAIQAWENNWGYVWGTYGNILTQSLFAYKLEQYPDGVGNYKDFIEEHWLGRRTTDCVGLIKGYGWLDTSSMSIRYATNGMPDYGANQMYQAAKNAGVAGVDYGAMDTMPEIVGLAVWKEGHIGVYIGGGYVVEAMGTKKGVVKTEVEGRGWEGWCKLPYIDYVEEE